jgi:O-antigen/teichoic acid export membrane protein
MARDLRKYARQTNVRLSIGFAIIIFLIGDGLIYYFYGREAAIMGALCILLGLVPLLLVFLAFLAMDLVIRFLQDRDQS